MHRLINFALLLTIAFIWASAFGAIKVAVSETGPVTLAAMRASIAAVILICFLRLKGPITFTPFFQNFGKFFLIGGVGTALPFVLIPWAEIYVDSSLAGLLMSIGPLATTLGAWALGYAEDISWRRLCGVMVGLMGVVILFSDGMDGLGTGNVMAQLVLVMASLCYVTGNLTVRKLTTLTPLYMSTMAMIFGCVLLWPVVWVVESPDLASWSTRTWQMVIWLSAASTAFAFSIRYYLIVRAGPSFTSYVGYLIPSIALLIGYFALDEAMTLDRLLALGFVLVGLVIAQKSPQKASSA